VQPSPRSLILDLLSTVGRASAPVRALVAAAGLFGIAENSLRVALARLLADGLVERDARGRYRLGVRAAALNEEIRAWRRVEERLVPWSGAWLAVHLAGLTKPPARARRERARALRVVGFRPLAPGLELRPDNLAGGVDAVRARLASLGLAAAGPVCVLDRLDTTWEARARALWDADELVQGYRDTRRSLERSAERLGELPVEAAMAESFRLGGAAIRQIVFDPLLPEPIVPAAERRALVAAMRHYDALGRRVWWGWLGDETPRDLPVGVHGPGAGAEALAAVERS
jgi:phenylacetic acid degradation operon negative regulatory protein